MPFANEVRVLALSPVVVVRFPRFARRRRERRLAAYSVIVICVEWRRSLAFVPSAMVPVHVALIHSWAERHGEGDDKTAHRIKQLELARAEAAKAKKEREEMQKRQATEAGTYVCTCDCVCVCGLCVCVCGCEYACVCARDLLFAGAATASTRAANLGFLLAAENEKNGMPMPSRFFSYLHSGDGARSKQDRPKRRFFFVLRRAADQGSAA